jgi:mRNA interferase HigB
MIIVGRNILEDFKKKHVDVCSQADSWCAEANAASWSKPSDIKQRYATASLLADNHVVFNLKGNKYRLLTQVNYKNQIILIKKVDTHNKYMKWKLN